MRDFRLCLCLSNRSENNVLHTHATIPNVDYLPEKTKTIVYYVIQYLISCIKLDEIKMDFNIEFVLLSLKNGIVIVRRSIKYVKNPLRLVFDKQSWEDQSIYAIVPPFYSCLPPVITSNRFTL